MSTPRISVLTPSIRPEYLDITYKCLKAQTFKDFEWLVEIDLPSDKFLLPKALNKMLARAKGEIIVMLQDCIDIPQGFLQHVVDTYNGDFVTYAIGKVKNKDFMGPVEFDWRNGESRKIDPWEWEADLASAPKKAFFDIGGYDEEFCNGWSWDNVEVGHRANAAGYRFRCDNRVYGLAVDHDKIIEHPFRNKLPNNDARARNTEVLCRIGDYKKEYLPN